ncbi:ParB N-terminal domain-containing protein [uncultured Oscillibacter sp.]|uniref:ParB/RepB/Spo0J family partition protein n=1 Tax=uncultured Oscillibacter sp. TaxID=876091 RepID=UPI0026341129|nr:ParB N-terminal domain-containing protein [uncultured Oscillibacter sp.]
MAGEVRILLVPISEITVNPGRREAAPGDVKELADSILEVGLINPIMVDQTHTLIAGLHRLEAMKLLGRTEIECTVSDLDGLQVELAEIDENFVRKDLSDDEFREMLLRRKEIYESLHPETKATYDGGAFRGNQHQNVVDENFSATTKSFVQDTADKLGVSPRTVELQIQTAKNLTPETKEIIKGAKVTKSDALKLSRLSPAQQTEAASRLVSGDIHSVDEYQPPPEPAEPEPPAEAPPPSVPYSSSGRHYSSFEESIADLKNPDKDCSYTPDALLAELDSFIQKFHREFAWYSDPFCTVVFPGISQVQFDYIRKRFGTISTAIHDVLQQMKRSMKK